MIMKLLSHRTAQAIYSAMCELNNVGGRLNDVVVGNVHVGEDDAGRITVLGPDGMFSEGYSEQVMFAISYGLE